MSGKSNTIKWHPMSEIMAKNIAANTATPGVWYPIAPSDLPGGIPQMPGIVTAHVSHYLTTLPAADGTPVFGEFDVMRTESITSKHYNYMMCSSSDGNHYFAGPRIDFPYHHIVNSSPVPIESIFIGHPDPDSLKRIMTTAQPGGRANQPPVAAKTTAKNPTKKVAKKKLAKKR